MNVFELEEWFSVGDTAAKLTDIEGTPVTAEGVLKRLIDGKLQGSLRSRRVFAAPLVTMTEAEAKSFIGTSWLKPDGERIARTGDVVVLSAIRPVLDLPVHVSGIGDLADGIYRAGIDPRNEVQIPPGTLIQTPNKDEYFAVMGGTDIPATYGQIVIRTEALREHQSRLTVHKKDRAANDVHLLDIGSEFETKVQRQDRRLKACEDAGLVMPKNSAGRLPDGVAKLADREGVTRQAFSSDVKAALKRRESAKREGVTVHRA